MKDRFAQKWASLYPIDVLVAGHCAVMILLVASRARQDPGAAMKFMSLYGAVMAGALVVAPALDRAEHPLLTNHVVRFLRHTYPMFLLGPFFQWTHPVSHLFFSEPFDDLLIRADLALFGFHIGRDLAATWGNRTWLTEWFNFSYLSYYWVTLYLPLYLYFTDRRREFFYVAFISGFTIYFCFLVQALFPAQGPVHYDPAGSGYLAAGPISELARLFLLRADIPGGAMPSGHVAGTIAIWIFARRFAPRAFVATSPIVISLCVATVYCRYHYAVDVIAGVITALVCVYLVGPRLFALLFPLQLPEGLEESGGSPLPGRDAPVTG
ncbi:MAG: inositol phosphorylceramide synthase [Spirochaetes bacterium]|nr:inositol phosphorylceramide synthase [Spirochaetota bacterium]